MSSEKILSAEQTRKLLHISKRKCAYLLEHRIIPCEITDRKTHRYLVREEDVLAYAEHADAILLPPVFSSAAGKSHRKEPDPRIRKSDFLLIWAKEPDALTPADVKRLTGYTGSTVRQWIRKGKLRAATVQSNSLVAKEWLAEFMSLHGTRIVHKSEVHLKILKGNCSAHRSRKNRTQI